MYTLLTSQKNEVFKIIQNFGLETANFSWDIGESTIPSKSKDLLAINGDVYFDKVPKLIYKEGQFYFQFELLKGQHRCTFSPGRETPFETHFPGPWVHLTNHIKDWLSNLQREIEAPNLWAEMEKYRISVSLDLPEQTRNESIPTYEAEEIANKLNMLADKIDELYELKKDQSKFVRSKLHYLAEAAKRQKSMDFFYTSIGVFGTIAMGLALEPNKTKELWQLMKSLVGPFLHLIGS